MWNRLHAHHWLRARRTLMFTNVALRTRRVLSPYTLYTESALLVLNGTSLNSINAILALNWWHINVLFSCEYGLTFLKISEIFLLSVNWGFQLCSPAWQKKKGEKGKKKITLISTFNYLIYTIEVWHYTLSIKRNLSLLQSDTNLTKIHCIKINHIWTQISYSYPCNKALLKNKG